VAKKVLIVAGDAVEAQELFYRIGASKRRDLRFM